MPAETAVANKYDINNLVLADDLFLYLEAEDNVVAFATSVSVDITADEIDCSNKMSSSWKVSLAGKAGYTLSTDALFTQAEGLYSYDKLMAAMLTRKSIDWKIGRATDRENFAIDKSKSYYSGKAVITSLNLQGGNGEVANCSCTLTGADAIELNTPAKEEPGVGA